MRRTSQSPGSRVSSRKLRSRHAVFARPRRPRSCVVAKRSTLRLTSTGSVLPPRLGTTNVPLAASLLRRSCAMSHAPKSISTKMQTMFSGMRMGRRYWAALAKLTACVAISLEQRASTLSRNRGRFKIAMALQPSRQTLIMDQRESIVSRRASGDRAAPLAKCLEIAAAGRGAAALWLRGSEDDVSASARHA